MTAVWIIVGFVVFYALVAGAGHRHQSARPDRRRDTKRPGGGPR